MPRILNVSALLALFCGAFLLPGCSDDDDVVAPPTTGSIMISPLPTGLEAPWHLSGPDDVDESGQGAQTLEGMAPGSYTLTWQDTAGYQTPTPADSTQELAAGQTITFTGTYAEIPPLDICAESRDALMALFQTIYSARDIEAYEDILSLDFLFVTDDQSDSYGLDVEMEITTKMFTGQPGIDGTALRRITVEGLQPMNIWQETPPDDAFFGDFPNSSYRSYEVDISFYVSGQDLRLRVQGLAGFYVVQETIGSQICFRYLGIKDNTMGVKDHSRRTLALGSSKATEDYTWSSVKSFFR